MLLTIFSEPPKCPPENPGKIHLLYHASVKKCVLEVFPTCVHSSRSCVSPKGEGGVCKGAQFRGGEEGGPAMAKATTGLRPCPPRWVTRGDGDDPSSGPEKLCPGFAASRLPNWISHGRSGGGRGWGGTHGTTPAPSHALASAGPAPGAHQSKPS